MKLSERLRLGIPANDPVCIAINWLAVLVLVWVAALSFPSAVRKVFAAQNRAPAPPNVRVVGMSIVPQREMTGAFTAFEVNAVVQAVEHLPSGEVVVKESRIVKFDLVRGAPESVTVNGASRLYADIAAALYAAAVQEYQQVVDNPASPPPLPGVERKTMRAVVQP